MARDSYNRRRLLYLNVDRSLFALYGSEKIELIKGDGLVKIFVLLVVAAFGFSQNASAMVPAMPKEVKVEGIKAQFLYDTLGKFDSVKGLEGTAEGALGTYYASAGLVVCSKDFNAQPELGCYLASTDPKAAPVYVSVKDLSAVSDLRRALREITGLQKTFKSSDVIRVQSINCEAHGVNTEMDDFELEPTYSCTIGYY